MTRQIGSGTIALVSILLTLWLSFAYIDHQVDTIPEHHNHHDCQLFANIQNGLKSATPVIQPTIVHGFIAPIAEPVKVSRPMHAYLARSPPITVLRLKS